jgi:hypothetical protein
MKQTAVEWLFEQMPDHLRLTRNGFEMLQQAKEMEKQRMIDLVQQLKDYTRESHNVLGFDEREASEFLEIFTKETFK